MSIASEASVEPRATPRAHKRWFQHLYIQVLIAVVLGVLVGHFYPSVGEVMKPLGDNFLKLIKLMIAPLIFCTVAWFTASPPSDKCQSGRRPSFLTENNRRQARRDNTSRRYLRQ